MTNFNIENSKIEQLNDKGNNVKITGASGNVVVSQNGDVNQQAGEGNRMQIGHKPSFFGKLAKKLWAWIVGLFK